jgi:hypothetical protein
LTGTAIEGCKFSSRKFDREALVGEPLYHTPDADGLKITSTSTLTGSVHTTVNALREAIAVQRMLERDPRGGTQRLTNKSRTVKLNIPIISLTSKDTLATSIGFKMKRMAKWIIRNRSSSNSKITSISNKWFRDENLQPSLAVPVNDGPDSQSDYNIERSRKRKDYCSPLKRSQLFQTKRLGTKKK